MNSQTFTPGTEMMRIVTGKRVLGIQFKVKDRRIPGWVFFAPIPLGHGRFCANVIPYPEDDRIFDDGCFVSIPLQEPAVLQSIHCLNPGDLEDPHLRVYFQQGSEWISWSFWLAPNAVSREPQNSRTSHDLSFFPN